jgi:hypothetical protein
MDNERSLLPPGSGLSGRGSSAVVAVAALSSASERLVALRARSLSTKLSIVDPKGSLVSVHSFYLHPANGPEPLPHRGRITCTTVRFRRLVGANAPLWMPS